jgi:hypothetical protein
LEGQSDRHPLTLSNRSGLTLRGQKISSIHYLKITAMTALARETREQSFEEMFVQHLENIYYPGFTEEMTEEQSALYDWEYKEFQKNFRIEN